MALGFAEVARKGYGGAPEVRAPSLYRLTYLPAWDAGPKDDTGTHDYLKIETDEEAQSIAARARVDSDPRNVERSKIHFATPQNVQLSPHEMGGETENSRPRRLATDPQAPGRPRVLGNRVRPTTTPDRCDSTGKRIRVRGSAVRPIIAGVVCK